MTPHGYYGTIRTDVIPFVPKCGGTLLDVGGGTGSTAAELRKSGTVARAGVLDAVAPDITPHGLDFVERGDIEAAGVIEDTGTSHGPFDVILALDVLEHLVDPWSMVARLHQQLVVGGTLVASIPNVRSYQVVLPLVFTNRFDYTDAGILDRTHLRFFTRPSAEALTSSSGLRIQRVEESPHGGRKVALIRRLTFGALSSFTARQFIIVATRVD